MPPKRDAAQLRALADDPLGGWLQTPVASRAAVGLAGDYLSAFLKHHVMPVSRQQVNSMHGPRLWQSKEHFVPEGQRNSTTVLPGGIVPLVQAFDHGFCAPVATQDMLLTFLQALPQDAYGEVCVQLQAHYALCRSFRSGEAELGSPPGYLDFYKDDRVPKKWRDDGAFESVMINANELLRTWPGLMPPSWNPVHAPRDALSSWEGCRPDAETLYNDLEQQGSCLSVIRFYALPLQLISFQMVVYRNFHK
jgi:hypothetical protein